jgi:hypothetical protein
LSISQAYAPDNPQEGDFGGYGGVLKVLGGAPGKTALCVVANCKFTHKNCVFPCNHAVFTVLYFMETTTE